MEKFIKHQAILDRTKSALVIVDIQERIYKVMRKHEKLIENVLKLIKGSKILNIPVYHTEQYPKGLGSTVEQINAELTGEAIQKLTFSCLGAEDLFAQLRSKNVEQVIVCGIETHVCVQQTVLDLLANTFQVYVPVNAVSSRSKIDYKTAINRMVKHGVEITTVESILFELLHICGSPEFKKVSLLIK
jgi:nicotinamidase-related amidase